MERCIAPEVTRLWPLHQPWGGGQPHCTYVTGKDIPTVLQEIENDDSAKQHQPKHTLPSDCSTVSHIVPGWRRGAFESLSQTEAFITPDKYLHGHHLSWTYPYFTRGEQINATLSLLSFYVQDRCCSHREWASLSWLRTQNHDSIGSKTSGFVGRFSFKYHSIIVQKNWECSVTNANGHKLNANPGILSL